MKIISIIRHMFKVRRQKIFYRNDPNAIITVKTKETIQISKVTLDNVERVIDFRTTNHVAGFRRYLAEGQYGVYAWMDGKVVGHGWAKICIQPRCIVNGYMDLHQGEALIHYCNVSEAYRGQNIYPFMLVALCHQLFDEAKVELIIIDTEVNNQASLHGIAKAGFKPLGSGIYFQFMGRRILKRVTTYDKTLTITLGKESINNGKS